MCAQRGRSRAKAQATEHLLGFFFIVIFSKRCEKMTQLLPSAQCNRQNFAASKLSSAAGEPSAPIRSAYQQLPSFLLELSRRERDPNKERRSKKSTRLWERQSKVRQMQETESVKSQQGSNPLLPPPNFLESFLPLLQGMQRGLGSSREG